MALGKLSESELGQHLTRTRATLEFLQQVDLTGLSEDQLRDREETIRMALDLEHVLTIEVMHRLLRDIRGRLQQLQAQPSDEKEAQP
jgi:hypothetical protein